MKTIYLAIKIILKQKWINLILILTIIFSVYYLVPTFSQMLHYATAVESLKLLDTDNAYYLYRSFFYGWESSELWEEMNKTIRNSDTIKGCANYYNLSDDTSSYYVMAYNQELIYRFTPKLTEGIWLNEIDETNIEKTIPAVVGSGTGLSYGELFHLPLTGRDIDATLTCEVVGVFAEDCGVVSFSASADDSYFTSDILISESDQVIIMPITDMILDYLGEIKYLASSKGSILYTTSETNVEDVVQEIGYAGTVTNLDKGCTRFREQSKIIISAMGVCWVIYFFVTMICMICSNVILNVKLNKIYTIYYMSGMSLKKRNIIDAVRIVFLVFTSSIVSYLFLLQNGLNNSGLDIKGKLLLFCGLIGYVSIIYIPISIWFINKQKKQNVIDCIRQLGR